MVDPWSLWHTRPFWADRARRPFQMLDFLRDELQFLLLILLWVGVAIYGGPLLFVVLPLSVFLMRSKELWAEMVFGFILILVLSDMEKDMFSGMRVFKSAKNTYLLSLATILIIDQKKFLPSSAIFNIFLPFFAYSILPILFSNTIFISIQKTISYSLMYLIIPNYILYNFRMNGIEFIKNLVWFLTTVLLTGLVLFYGSDSGYVGGRFRGLFGNPNALGIFSFLVMIIATTVNINHRSLFTIGQKILIYAVILLCIVLTGSRTSLVATAIFLVFQRFFSRSPFLGFIALLAAIGIGEAVSSNIEAIVSALGLEEYLRLETLEGGSGRYFAWQFAWGHIQDYFVFGGGFANDEHIFGKWRRYLEMMGHQGGAHSTYLSMWLNVGIVGLLIFLRSLFLVFIKAAKIAPVSLAILFSVLFSITYESWLVGSLNPFTILFIIIMTLVTEPEIVNWQEEHTAGEEASVPEVQGDVSGPSK
jgi:O-antigen ligase